jgi:hypothetical protein
MRFEYLGGTSIVDRIHNPRKLISDSSIVWKVLVDSFPLINN